MKISTTNQLTKATKERLNRYNIEVTKTDLRLVIGIELQDIEVIPNGLFLVEIFGASEESNGYLRFIFGDNIDRNKVINNFLDELDWTK